jgi:branched-chain amino acid transport system permease protein
MSAEAGAQPRTDAPAPSARSVEPTRSRWKTWRGFALVVVLVAALPLVTGSQYHLHVAILTLLNAALVMSLGLVARTGQINLAHAAFAGIGGYTSALCAMELGLPPIIGVVLGGVVAGLVALPLGWIILRLRGVYFVLITFTFGQMVTLLALDLRWLTRGADGIVGVPPINILGYDFTSRISFFYLAGAFCLMVFLISKRLLEGPVGREFMCVEENLQLAESTGIDTRRTQVIAFVIGTAIAGMAGALMTHYIRYIAPDSFTFWMSVAYITMLVVGGRWTLIGAFLGALLLTPLPEFLRATGDFQRIIYGVLLIVVLQFLPNGLSSLPGRFSGLGERWRRKG